VPAPDVPGDDAKGALCHRPVRGVWIEGHTASMSAKRLRARADFDTA
jgi:hypothetical protein